jgi:hypothetical protein
MVKVSGGWRRLHHELHNLYSGANIRVSKSRMMIWVGLTEYIVIGKF